MLRLLIFKNTELNSELALPVTPESFSVDHGIKVETINIHTLGDVNVFGYPTLATIKIPCMFPARYYPFNNFANTIDPYEYVKIFLNYCDYKPLLRYIVSGTSINLPVKMENIEYGEKDGTNDVYATLTMREQRELAVVKVQTTSSGSGSISRSLSAGPAAQTSAYTIKSGDTLSAICRKFYGDATLYSKLAAYNGIKNANLIKVGSTLKMPSKSQL